MTNFKPDHNKCDRIVKLIDEALAPTPSQIEQFKAMLPALQAFVKAMRA